jgi:membrane protein implicated in regulation of membrane protease activity
MFFFFSSFRVFGLPFCLLLVGIFLPPVQAWLVGVGGMAIAAGLIMLTHAPISGMVFMVVGIAMIVAGRKWQVWVDETAAEELEATAAGWRNKMGPQIPLDDER